MSGRPRGRPPGRRSKPLERVTEVRRRRIRESDDKRQLRLQLYRESQRQRRQETLNTQQQLVRQMHIKKPKKPLRKIFNFHLRRQRSSQENIENPPNQDSRTLSIHSRLHGSCVASDSTEQCEKHLEDIGKCQLHLDPWQHASHVASENGQENWLEEQTQDMRHGEDMDLQKYKCENMPYALPLEISHLHCDALHFQEQQVSNSNTNSFGGSAEKTRFYENKMAKQSLFTQVYLPQYNIPEIKPETQREVVPRVIKKRVENDIPIFKAKGVKKTYQAKSRGNPNDEQKPTITKIKNEMEEDVEVFLECAAEDQIQSHVEDTETLVSPKEPLCEVFLPRYYLPEEESVIQRAIVDPPVIKEIEENSGTTPVEAEFNHNKSLVQDDFPVFEAKKVKKTYQTKRTARKICQAKRKVNPEQESKPFVTDIKKEMAENVEVFPGCAATIEETTLQSHDEGGTETIEFHKKLLSKDPIPPENIKMEIKLEPIDEEYEDDIIRFSIDSPIPKHQPEVPIKQEPEDNVTVDKHKILSPESSHPRVRPMHRPKYKYPCSRCNRMFRTARKYILHFTTHGIAYMSCPVCQQSFENMTRLIPHLTNHVKQSYLKIIVNESAPGKRKNARTEVIYQCKVCKSKMEHDDLYSHWDTHFKTGWRSNELDDCVANDMTLKSEALKTVIENLVASKIDMIAKDCVICHRHFERKTDCKRHMIEHLLTDAYCNKPIYGALRCQICHVGFQKSEHFKLHMCDHGSLPVYTCDICDRAFSDSSNFTKHKKVHNLQGNNCDKCSKKFQAKSSLLKHLETHSTKPITYSRFRDRDGKVKCHLCGKKYTSLKEKWEHLWLVHKERQHKADCPICKKEFRRRIDVKSHVMKEHAVLPARKARKTDDIEEFLRDNPALELTEAETIVNE